MQREQRVYTWDHWHENSAPRFPHEKAVQFTYRNYRQNPLSADFCALDLGCGNGVHTELLTDLGMSVTSVDISPVALGKTQERISARHLQQPKIIEGLLSEIDFQSHSFDLILSIGVLDYAGQAETRAVVPRFQQWLRPGGQAFLVFAAQGDFREGTVGNLDLHCYTRTEVEELLSTFSGFRIWVDEYITTYENNSHRQIDWLITLRRMG